MMKTSIALFLVLLLAACGPAGQPEEAKNMEPHTAYTVETRMEEVAGDPVFEEYGRLIFPVNRGYMSGETLGELGLTWYRNIDPETTVEITNYLREHAENGDTVFYDIYTAEEKAAAPAKEDTGLSEYSPQDPPTYVCVGKNDGIASWRTMEHRLEAMSAAGIDTEFHAYEGLGHGFGLGAGTVAEGWIKDAIAFWENHME